MRLNWSDLTIETPKEWKVSSGTVKRKAHSVRWQALTVAIGFAIKPVSLSGKWANNDFNPVRDNRQSRRLKIESQRQDGEEGGPLIKVAWPFISYSGVYFSGERVHNVSTIYKIQTSPRARQDAPEYKRALCEFRQQAQKPGTRCLGPSMDPSATP